MRWRKLRKLQVKVRCEKYFANGAEDNKYQQLCRHLNSPTSGWSSVFTLKHKHLLMVSGGWWYVPASSILYVSMIVELLAGFSVDLVNICRIKRPPLQTEQQNESELIRMRPKSGYNLKYNLDGVVIKMCDLRWLGYLSKMKYIPTQWPMQFGDYSR